MSVNFLERRQKVHSILHAMISKYIIHSFSSVSCVAKSVYFIFQNRREDPHKLHRGPGDNCVCQSRGHIVFLKATFDLTRAAQTVWSSVVIWVKEKVLDEVSDKKVTYENITFDI